MKNSYEIRARKFVKQIAPFLINCEKVSDFEMATYFFNKMYHRKVHCAHGLTRVAFVTSDYVVKVEYGYEYLTYGGCSEELALYEDAVKEGFAYLLAKIEHFHYLDMDFYIMPRIGGIGRTEEDANSYMTDEELDWCDTHDLHDLHNWNYGWKDNHIVLIDYAAHS